MLTALRSRLMEWRAARGRIIDRYRREHDGRTPNLFRPRRYSEKVQWRKLFDLDRRYAILSDKLAVRDFIADRLGRAHPEGAYLVPLLWHGDDPDLIPFDTLEPPYVLKSTHACAHVVMVNEGDAIDRDAMRATARGWLEMCHGTLLDEPGYVPVPRRLIVERTIRTAQGARPIERKFFTFDGKVTFVQTVFTENGAQRHGAFHTPDWEWRPWYFTRALPEVTFQRPPLQLERMLAVAARLGAGFEHLRVDMYDLDDRFCVGEMTVYPWSGFARFNPDEADYLLGAPWKLRHPLLRAFTTILTRHWKVPAPAAGGRLRPAYQSPALPIPSRPARS
jgi:hypothetical protein